MDLTNKNGYGSLSSELAERLVSREFRIIHRAKQMQYLFLGFSVNGLAHQSLRLLATSSPKGYELSDPERLVSQKSRTENLDISYFTLNIFAKFRIIHRAKQMQYLFLGFSANGLAQRSPYNPIKTFSTVKGASTGKSAFGLNALTAWRMAK